ncbi:hypothetical protein COCOBI_13-0340 [Coccomyxa sp. Obi]|nr:hypothetical protein COCOBI_13-0340 [Coccomyxa sp. Obi]
MGSKSVGEPPLLLSASAMSAFAAAVAAAREDFSCDAKSGSPAGNHPARSAKSGDGADVGARSGGRAVSAITDNDVSAREAAVQELCAPVTVKAVRAAVGSLHLPTFLEQYA